MVQTKSTLLTVNVSMIHVFSNIVTNGSTSILNSSLLSSSAVASLVFSESQSILISGKPPNFLPELTVVVNLSTNYTRILVIIQAASPSLAFVPVEDSYIEVVPKCNVGTYVASSSASYDCLKCPKGSYSNYVDSMSCRYGFGSNMCSRFSL